MYNSWPELENACNNCKKCKLCDTRHNVVIGRGNKEAPVLFVGEGPGEQEDLTGKPFVGPAGRLLDLMLASLMISEKDYYIANIVKCRPPSNRDPKPDEIDMCIDYLRNQYLLIKPKIVVCLGRIAATQMIRKDFKITKEHGIWFDKKSVKMIATYHPAAILHDQDETSRKKEEMFADLIKVKRYLDENGYK